MGQIYFFKKIIKKKLTNNQKYEGEHKLTSLLCKRRSLLVGQSLQENGHFFLKFLLLQASFPCFASFFTRLGQNYMGEERPLGMITFVNTSKTRLGWDWKLLSVSRLAFGYINKVRKRATHLRASPLLASLRSALCKISKFTPPKKDKSNVYSKGAAKGAAKGTLPPSLAIWGKFGFFEFFQSYIPPGGSTQNSISRLPSGPMGWPMPNLVPSSTLGSKSEETNRQTDRQASFIYMYIYIYIYIYISQK